MFQELMFTLGAYYQAKYAPKMARSKIDPSGVACPNRGHSKIALVREKKASRAFQII
jgi:radical SAM superfamily enzyme